MPEYGGFGRENCKKEAHLENPDIVERIILKLVPKHWYPTCRYQPQL